MPLAHRPLLLTAIVWLLCSGGARADTEAEVARFYAGKTINMYIGFDVGGSYDFYGRLFAQYMGRHIPGHPSIVAQTMAGAGSLRAANHLYNVAPKDGTSLAVVTQTLILEEVFKTAGVKYKAAEFNWIGRMTAVLETLVVSGNAKAKSAADVRQHETIAAGTGPTSPSEGYPRLLNAFAGTRFKVVSGYPGSTQALVALERGEIDVVEVSWNTIRRTKMDWIRSGKLAVIVQAGFARSAELPDIPTLIELATTPEGKAAMELYTSANAVSRPLIAAPGVPEARVKALRDAFMATTRDREFLAHIERSNAEFDPAPGEMLEDLARKVAATPQGVVDRTVAALQPK